MEVIAFAEGRHVFFRVGKSVLLCFLPESTRNEVKLPPHYGSGKLHFALETPYEQYEAWKNKIIKAGIIIEQETDWSGNLKSFYFRDPDGHLAEIVMEGIWDP